MADPFIDKRIEIKVGTRRVPCIDHRPCGWVHRKTTGWYKITVDGKALDLASIFVEAKGRILADA